MKIQSVIDAGQSAELSVVYEDVEVLPEKEVSAVHAFCFLENKLVIVYHGVNKHWTLPGGAVETGESVEDAVIREVHEESNMRVVAQKIIGYQDILEDEKIITQTRSICLVESYGDFVSDPDGDIIEIKLIDPQDIKKYVDWGKIGDHLITRALELLPTLRSQNIKGRV